MANGDVSGFIVPAFNLRTLVLDLARAVFRAAKKEKAQAFILELAPSEMGYTNQSLKDYRKTILKAAEKEKFDGPLFLQGDHFKINKEKDAAHLKKLVKKAVKAGFYNIDIDCSSMPMEKNALQTATMAKFIKSIQPKGVNISVGGEIGVIGGKNTALEEFRKFIRLLEGRWKGEEGLLPIIKIAIQTGTSHGGIMLKDKKMKRPDEDFQALKEISLEAKKYGLGGAVQHGASTLPEEYFSRFPATGACEIHLATLFQNMIYDSQYFPEDLKNKIYGWVREKYKDNKKEGETDFQFIYRNRKLALGPFKKEINRIPQKTKDNIAEEIEDKFRFFFRVLKVSGTDALIKEIYY